MALVCACLLATARADVPTGLQENVTFSDYPAQAAVSQIIGRLLSPLSAEYVRRTLALSHRTLAEHSLDISAEHYLLYVPKQPPASGYALLVFIPPWNDARLPAGWAPVLDRLGVIFASAAASGNDANDIERRVPLALIAAVNLMRRYAVDPQRVYVGGFSGGARVALRVALGYPDLIHGALLNAGSDAVDAGPPTPPSAELLERFQESTRIVFVTGADDPVHLQMDAASAASLQRWCVFDYASSVTLGATHEVARTAAFAEALQLLLQHRPPDAAKLTACRAAVNARLDQQLQHVSALISRGERSAAERQLIDVDLHFGGIASARTLQLESDLGWRFTPR
jgi:predicted esterase